MLNLIREIMPSADLTELLQPFLTAEFKAQYTDFSNINEVDQYFIQQKKLRESSNKLKTTLLCLVDSTIQNQAYFFSPLISSALKYKTHFIATQSSAIYAVYEQYFRIAALELHHSHAIDEMDLCLDLISAEKNLALHTMFTALSDHTCQQVICLGSALGQAQKRLLEHYGIQTHYLETEPHTFDLSNVNLQQLFWKRKNELHATLCQQITAFNVPFIQYLTQMKNAQVARLIDDLMYGEHMLEKVSVFGEFTETIYKQQMS